jgi:hypothetical protein
VARFIPSNCLELLQRAATDPVARLEFYRELLTSTLHFLGPEDQPSLSTSDGTLVSIIMWEGPCAQVAGPGAVALSLDVMNTAPSNASRVQITPITFRWNGYK